MTTCQNQLAARHAFPASGPMPVQDRQMTLTLACREPATSTLAFLGTGTGRQRTGAVVKTFDLCENHAEVYQQIDTELVQDGWTRSLAAKPTQIV
jgi:hypothetical protein